MVKVVRNKWSIYPVANACHHRMISIIPYIYNICVPFDWSPVNHSGIWHIKIWIILEIISNHRCDRYWLVARCSSFLIISVVCLGALSVSFLDQNAYLHYCLWKQTVILNGVHIWEHHHVIHHCTRHKKLMRIPCLALHHGQPDQVCCPSFLIFPLHHPDSI